MPDIFDQLTAEVPQQEGDIFDQIAPDSGESSSSRGASSISAPRSPVAAPNATSAGSNPAAGSTAFAPQPSSQREMLGPLAAPGSALPNVAPAAHAQGVSAENKPPVPRAPAQQTIAPPVQQQNQVIQQSQAPPATKQAPASASNTGVMQQPNWRYIAEHPELPEYRSLYSLALSHLSPEEKREIVNKRIAAYPETAARIEREKVQQRQARLSAQEVFKEPEPIMDPLTGFPTAEVKAAKVKYENAAGAYVNWTPREKEILSKLSAIEESSTRELEFANRYAVEPFNRLSRWGGQKTASALRSFVFGPLIRNEIDKRCEERGVQRLSDEEEQQIAREVEARYPRLSGIINGVGETVGSTIFDPRMWPFFYAGPEVAGTRFLSRAASSTLRRAAAAGFTAQMAVGAAQQAAQVHAIWNRKDISLDEKYKAITELVLNAMMLAHSTRSMVRGEPVPRPQSLDPRMVAEINAMGDEAKLQILARVMRKVAEQQKPENQTREIIASNERPRQPAPAAPKMKARAAHAQPPALPADVRVPETAQKSASNSNGPSSQLAAIASRSDIPPAQKHELMANVILGELTPQSSAASPFQEKPVVASAVDGPVDVMKRYMQANNELPPPAESKVPSRPQVSLDPERIAPIGQDLASLSHTDRQGVLINLHDKLTQAIFEQGKILAPDGQLHVVSSPAEAAKLAQQLINDSIQKHDQRAAQNQNATQRIASPISSLRSSLAATPEGNVQVGMSAGRIPEMGHGMTVESPAVRRVKAESRPVRGQEPAVKVKQEPPAIQSALAQPPAPVHPEEAARIGQRDPQSGRMILQPSNSVIQNERLANHAAPELDTRLSRIADSVPGAKFDRLRPQKGLERLQEKVADGKPARTIGDNLAAQIVAPNPEAKDQIIAHMNEEFPVISVDDKFLQPREKAGYPSANVQVQMPNGSTAEVQIVAPEIQAITDQTHRLYTQGRNFPEGSAERAHYWDQAAAMHTQALEKFRARNAQEQFVNQLAPGQRVVLKNGQTGKIVGFADKTGRIIVRTSKGLRTVRPEKIQARITRFDPTQARLTGGLATEKIQKFKEAFVPISSEGVADVAAKVESSIEAGDERMPDVVWANHPVGHLIWHWEARLDAPFTGVFLDRSAAVRVAERFEENAVSLKNAGRTAEATAAKQVASHIRNTAAKNGAVAITLRTGEAAYDLMSVREERGHVIQNRIGGGDIDRHANFAKLWLEPEFQKATVRLIERGYRNNPPTITLEAATKLLLGEGDSMGLTDAEQVSAIRKYLRSIKERWGPDAADDLKLVTEPKYHRIFEEVKGEPRTDKR